MEKHLLGIDYGTGGAKAVLINTRGEELAYAFEEYPIITDHPGWSEHDANRYWEAARRLVRQCLKESGADASSVAGVAVSSALPSLVLVDEQIRPVHRAYNLMDKRATAEVRWLKENIGETAIFRLSKNRLEDHPIITNLMWERNNRPEEFRRIHKALTIDGFINAKLTGRFTTHYSAAAFYGVAYDLLNREFNGELLDRIGLSADLFPELFRCEDIIGTVTSEAAEATGLAEGTPVAAGQVDCNAGWMGAGAVDEGDLQMNLGTCGNFGIITRNTDFSETMINFAYTTHSEETYIIVPTTTTGGQLIRYMRDNFYRMEMGAQEVYGEDTFDLINREAGKVPPGSEGLLTLPYLMGERTPIWDVYARGTLFGLSLHHTRGHVIRSMMESVGYALYDSFRIIKESGRKISPQIVLNEGGAKSKLWRSIITDIFATPTVLVKRRTGAPFGDAILAGVATGIFPDFSIAREWTEFVEPMEPDMKNHELYMEYFGLYKELYHHVKDDFRTLAGLREKYSARKPENR